MRVLLAVDDSENSRRAVRHVARVAADSSHLTVTLFHVPVVPEGMRAYGESRTREEDSRLEALMDSKTEAAIERDRQQALEEIFGPAERILRKEAPDTEIERRFGPDSYRSIGSAVVAEARRGGYDVIALGRRGGSALRELAFGSVSSTVLHHARDCAVWIID